MSKAYDDITGGQPDGQPRTSNGDVMSVFNPNQKEQQEYVDNGGVMPIKGVTPSPEPTPITDSSADKKKSAEVRVAEAAPAENFYQTYLDELKKDHDEDEERIKKAEKRLKRQKIFSAIGDGLSAIHEAYSYGRGIEPIILPKFAGKWRERYDKLQNERRTGNLTYAKAKLDAMAGKRRDELADLQAKYQKESLELRKQEEERRQIAANNAVRKQDWLEKYQKGLLDIKKEQQRIDEDYKKGVINIRERDAASRELQAQAAYLRAQKTSGGGGSRVGGYTTTTTINRDDHGREVERTTTRTPAKGNQDNYTPPSRRRNQDNRTPPSRKK